MATFRDRPYPGTNFRVDLGTGDAEGPLGGFSEVVMPAGTIDVVEYRSGNSQLAGPLKLVGSTRYRNVILKRGVMGSLDLYEWWDQARNGEPDVGRSVTIALLAEDRTTEVMRWKLTNAWPVGYETTDLSGMGSEVLVEAIELTYDRLDVE